jgi:hypothetical protein
MEEEEWAPAPACFWRRTKERKKIDSGKEKEKTVKNTDVNGMIPV